MAKRVVQECDLTKQEYDPAETVTLIIKRSGKKTGRTYELSSDAAAKLEAQLVSSNKLPINWSFVGSKTDLTVDKPRTIGDLDTDDEQFIAEKKKALKDEGVDLSSREPEEGQAEVLPSLTDGTDCLHMNKGPINTTLKGDKRHFYRTCRECRKRIPEKPKDDRQSFLTAKAPADSRVDYRKD